MSPTKKQSLSSSQKTGKKIGASTNTKHQMIIGKYKPPFEITLDIQIDPGSLEHARDEFTLYSTDDAQTYKKMLSIKDDRVEGDKLVTLTFVELDPELNYTMEVYQGGGAPTYNLFVDVAYSDLKEAEKETGYFDPEETEEPEEEEAEDEDDEEEDEVELNEDQDDETEKEPNLKITDAEIDEVYDEIIKEEKLDDV